MMGPPRVMTTNSATTTTTTTMETSSPNTKRIMLNRPIPYRRICLLSAHGAKDYVEQLWGGPMPTPNDAYCNNDTANNHNHSLGGEKEQESSNGILPPLKRKSEESIAASDHDIGANSSALMSGEDGDDTNEMEDFEMVEKSTTTTNNGNSNDNDDDDDDNMVIKSAMVYKAHKGLLGKYSVRKDIWEPKRLVLTKTQLLYYNVDMTTDDTTTTSTTTSAGAATTAKAKQLFSTLSSTLIPMATTTTTTSENNLPQGELDLVPRSSTDNNDDTRAVNTEENDNDAFPPAPPSIVAQALPAMKGNPTPYSIQVKSPTTEWKFCFESQTNQVEWLDALVDMVGSNNRQSNNEDDVPHNFQAGDHIIRWEMLPIVYPIQIHGIVLEAGKNCVIIADFGLTSYYQTKNDELDTVDTISDNDDHPNNEDQQKDVMDAWKVLRPKEKKRLNVVALTDKKEIRQWSKVNYGRSFFSGNDEKSTKTKKFKKWLSSLGTATTAKTTTTTTTTKKKKIHAAKELEEAKRHIETWEGRDVSKDTIEFEVTYQEPNVRDMLHDQLKDPDWWIPRATTTPNNEEERENEDDNSEQDEEKREQQQQHDNDNDKYYDDDFHKKFEPVRHPKVFDMNELNGNDDDDDDAAQQDMKMNKLPKSDPTKIVLARTNFLLEFGEEILPPYHVFHSNSECIAVWCKTGRWSTLQTAIFLHSTAVGNAKSATVMAMGVAAAHVFLLPVMAIGGLVAVSAPWMILKKSKNKWDEATMKLTELFWERAEPEVFVEAIEHWSGLIAST